MTMRTLIGDKGGFGIEYEIQSSDSHVMGNMRLWLGGKYVGAFDDVNILSVALFQLEGVDSKRIDGCEFVDEAAGKVYEIIESGDIPDNRRYLLMPGEAFDDFSIYWYACNGNLYFVWKLIDNPFFEYPDYPRGIQSAQVSIDEFLRIVAEFRKTISIASGAGGG